MVIKPDDGSSAAGIWAVRDAKELDELASRIRQWLRTEAGPGTAARHGAEGVLTTSASTMPWPSPWCT